MTARNRKLKKGTPEVAAWIVPSTLLKVERQNVLGVIYMHRKQRGGTMSLV